MASIDLRRPELLLSQVGAGTAIQSHSGSTPISRLAVWSSHVQFPDSQTYVRVITKLAMLQPLEVGIGTVASCTEQTLST